MGMSGGSFVANGGQRNPAFSRLMQLMAQSHRSLCKCVHFITESKREREKEEFI
jgi:hypothetical protein